jgi:hypothetical protein
LVTEWKKREERKKGFTSKLACMTRNEILASKGEVDRCTSKVDLQAAW